MTTPLRLFPTEDETIAGTARALRERRVTCRDVLERCFERIDEWEPKVRAWVIVDRDYATEQARRLDEELAAGKDRGPLHGIPVGIKDIIDVVGLPTACGAKHWAQGPAEADAPLVAALRNAGAVILGKTVTTPYAWIDPPVTRNPWNLDRTPGGSSSGSAAAVACGMCLGAIGTQTGGSITRPASFCGIAGHKPVFSRHLTEGILPFAPSLDHPGPLARTVTDLQLLHEAPIDRLSAPYSPGELVRKMLASRTTSEASAQLGLGRPGRSPASKPLPPPRIGCLGGAFRDLAEPSMREAIDEAISVFLMNGAEIIKTPLPVDHAEVVTVHRTIMASEAAAFHERRLREMPDDYPPQITALVTEGLALSAAQYVRSRNRSTEMWEAVRSLFANVDVLLTPAALGPAPGPSTTGSPAFNSPWSLWGVPTVTFPIRVSPDGLPLGVQIIGSHVNSPHFIAASWCEAAIRRAYESRSL